MPITASAKSPQKAELLTGIEGASARPVRRIVLITNPVLAAAPTTIKSGGGEVPAALWDAL
jgi:hypothetical protein